MRGTIGLIGRSQESARLAAVLAEQATTRSLVVTGEAGVGKTELLTHLATDAAGRGWQVLRSTCAEAEQQYPYSSLDQVLRHLEGHVGSLSDHQRHAIDVALGREAADGPAAVPTLGAAVLDLLNAAAVRSHCLVVVDDVHWADDAGAAVLVFVARRLGPGSRVAMVLGARTGEPTRIDTGGIDHLDLTPLDPPSAEQLLSALHPDLSPDQKSDVLDRAAGNPLAITELPAWPSTVGTTVGTTLHPAADPALPLPRRIEQVYARKLARLPADEQAELLLLALDGAAGPDGDAGYRPAAVEAARSSGLVDVRPATGRARFRHPLVRSAVIQTATPDQVRSAHARLAARHATDPLRHAFHLAAATTDPDDDVAGRLESAAADATRRGGASVAVHLLTRAADLTLRPGDRDRLLADAAFVAGQAGLLDAAEELLNRADRLAGDLSAPRSVLTAAYVVLYRDGAVQSAHRMLADVLRRRPDDVDPTTLHRAVTLLLTIGMYAADADLWHETEQIVDDHSAVLPPEILLYRDTWGDVLRHADGARTRLADAFATTGGEPWDVMRLAVSAYFVDALVEHRPVLRRLVEREADGGAVANVMTVLHLTVLDQVATGQWAEATATAERGIVLSERHGYRLFTYHYKAFLARALAQRGLTEQAHELGAVVEAWARPRGVGLLTQHVTAARLAAALTTGDHDTAWTDAVALAEPGSFRPYVHESHRTLLDHVLAAESTGHHTEARRHALAARAHAVDAVSPRMAMLSTAALAVTDTTDAAGELFAAAVASPASATYPFDTARVLLAYGMWARRQRANSQARALLTQAVDLFRTLGTRTWVDRAAHELGLTGLHERGEPMGLAHLTAQERTIAELAATGLTNKQIGARLYLSPRTIGTHLYRIFPKLGVTSRAALRDALAAAGPAAAPATPPDRSSD
ncbi:AAA family ATPase [Promicromonospora thailandica]|uniref:ATPase n=1 Tax=Promicromonospora thailandica TaxID=765201 RepID=A0A9X2G293_9MICO|nr:LuxR family transcriptional regulator [Promicromonospora thailandica]MCP2265499.1 putative ATPase [Promicromonospora thailandica]